MNPFECACVRVLFLLVLNTFGTHSDSRVRDCLKEISRVYVFKNVVVNNNSNRIQWDVVRAQIEGLPPLGLSDEGVQNVI